jgi:hypothetical protein
MLGAWEIALDVWALITGGGTVDLCDNPTRDNSVLSPKPLHLVIKR